VKPRTSRTALALATLTYALLHLPVAVLVVFSLNRSRYGTEWTGFTLDWYRRLAERPDLLRGLWLSLLVGVLSTLIATVLGTLFALALEAGRVRARRALDTLVYLPVLTPEIVAGISLLVCFAALGIPLGLGTILIAHIAFSVALVAIVVRARLAGLDRTQHEAALLLGADELTVFRTITLPQLAPGIVAGALLAFIMSFDDYVITSLVAGPGASTLPMLVYGMVRRNVEPTVNAISTLTLLFTSLAIWIAWRLTRARPLAAARG
jgi:spermidine/putrescine transport system permease protein